MLLLLAACRLQFAPGTFEPHVYLGWRSEDTATTIQVSYHTSESEKESIVRYDIEPRHGDASAYRFLSRGQSVVLPGADRRVHHVELTGLAPGTPYYFLAGSADSGGARERKFRTLRHDGSGVRIVNGGDMGTGRMVDQMTTLAAAASPDLALIGGDIAYANGDAGKLELWDRWLSIWGRNMVTPEGWTIPMVLAVGNHETNLIRMGGDRRLKAPFYYALFNQTGDERSYFARKLDRNLTVLAIDSAHLHAPFGKQRRWLVDQLEKRSPEETIMALYHVGLYPSHRSFLNPLNSLVRLSWQRVFDHFRLPVALEHHDHTLKRTKTLRMGREVAPGEGTLYLGDGAWGKAGREADPSRWYLAHTESRLHFWQIDVRAREIEFQAVSETGEVLDRHTLQRQRRRRSPRFELRESELFRQIDSDPELRPFLEDFPSRGEDR